MPEPLSEHPAGSFSQFNLAAATPQDMRLACQNLLRQAKLSLAQFTQTEQAEDTAIVDWDNTVSAVEDIFDALEKIWGTVQHACAVIDSPEWREVYAENLPGITALQTALKHNKNIYQRFQTLAKNTTALDQWQQHILHKGIQDFRLNGVALAADKQKRLAEIEEEIALLAKHFSENILDTEKAYHFIVNESDKVSGIPQATLKMMADAAQEKKAAGWCFNLHYPIYSGVMKYADNVAVRERLFYAYVTRCSGVDTPYDVVDRALDNSENIVRQLQLKQELAQLLGFEHYAAYSLANKMAVSAQEVDQFLADFAQQARPKAETEWRELQEFSRSQGHGKALMPWDIPYMSEKLRQQHYTYSEEEWQQYFPLEQALSGLFHCIQKLFRVTVQQVQNLPVWHPDVRVYSLKNQAQDIIAYCYFDPYCRANKQNGAWMHSAQSRRRSVQPKHTAGEVFTGQLPIAYLTTNFAVPSGDQPCLLYHDDLLTLFHEWGHGLHHMLTQMDYLSCSGINGVEWDAVELPSQMMEQFCWEADVLAQCSCHPKTGESLPAHLLAKRLQSRNFQKGLATLRQLIFAKWDFDIHRKVWAIDELVQHTQSIAQSWGVLPFVTHARYLHSFSHLFAGGYAAGYYSYKWAEVLAADVYTMFATRKNTLGTALDVDLGQRYQQEILAVGGGRPALASFQAFCGRSPDIQALLRQDDLIAVSA